MRITREAKTGTRQRILKAAVRLFRRDGWETTTTRQIAAASGIATGTLFNYFPCKEAIAAVLMAEALESAEHEFADTRREDSSLEEDLFSLIWTGLKRLRQYREFLGPAAETIFSPLAQFSANRPGDEMRARHLARVEDLMAARGRQPLRTVTLQLYWTLYRGVLAFWAADASPNQEDTLALLDQSIKLFLAALDRRSAETGDSRGSPAW